LGFIPGVLCKTILKAVSAERTIGEFIIGTRFGCGGSLRSFKGNSEIGVSDGKASAPLTTMIGEPLAFAVICSSIKATWSSFVRLGSSVKARGFLREPR